MQWYEIVALIFSILGIPGLILLYIKKRFDKNDARDLDRATFLCMLKIETDAGISLGEELALSLKRGTSNGELDKAMKYASDCKHETNNFVTKQASKNLI